MMLFVLFLAAGFLYVSFLIWCLAPLKQPAARFRKTRLALAAFLFFSFFPLLSLPSMVLLAPLGTSALAVANLPMTLPAYVMNVWKWPNTMAATADVVFDFSVSGTSYSVTLKVACMFRAGIDSDKIVFVFNENIPTISGNKLLARVGSDFVALHFSDDLCHMVVREKDEVVRHTRAEIALISGVDDVMQGKAAVAKLDMITAQPRTKSERALTLEPVSVIRTGSVPAKEVISMNALWPMREPEETMGGLLPNVVSGSNCARTRIMHTRAPEGVDCAAELRKWFVDKNPPMLEPLK